MGAIVAIAGRAGLAGAVAIACLVAAGCGGDSSEDAGTNAAPRPAATSLFDYDRSRPLRLEIRGAVNPDEAVKVYDLSYESPRGGRVNGFLVVPPGKGPFPAALFMHGAGGSRLSLLNMAAWLAARRAVGLAIDSPFSREPLTLPRGLAGVRKDRDLNVQNVVDLRRAVDVLETRKEVDAKRIGYVGYSAGARTGAVLAGVEKRVRAFVLMSGGATPAREYANAAPTAVRADVLRILTSADPLRFVRRAAPSALLFQNGRRDEIVPREALSGLAAAASEPKEVRWYGAGHELSRRAYREALDWLAGRLRVEGPPVPGQPTGP